MKTLTAADIMTSPARTVSEGTTLVERARQGGAG